MKGKNLLIGGLFLITAQLVLQSCSGSNQLPQLGKDKIETVIAAMTPEEKIGMTVGDGKFLPATDPKTIEQGLGIIIANQNSKMVIPRLSIMTSALTDGPSGVNRDPRPAGATDYSYTTAFPTSTCLAATWNTEMLEIVGKAFGNEVLEYEYDVVLMPALNLHRNPKCGRNFEYYSEDPLLSGKLSASIIRGLQSNGIGATLKHFLANNQETNRRIYNAVISQRALREIYLHGFEIAVKEGKPKAIMTSYNKVNGYYTAETQLLQPGESQQLSFELDACSLASFWSGISAWVADKGNYEVRIGASSKDIRLKSSFNLPKDIIVEKVHDVMYPNFAMKELSQLNKQ